jgi:ribonuclease E
MGVSPLIYAQQEPKDPRSVLVYVKKPGEELIEEELPATVDDREVEQLKTGKPKTKIKKAPAVEETESESVVRAEPEPEPEIESEPAVTEETSTGRRRRRRRSSAKKTEV